MSENLVKNKNSYEQSHPTPSCINVVIHNEKINVMCFDLMNDALLDEDAKKREEKKSNFVIASAN